MNPKSPKPKFIPPLKTAASYLRTISDSPELLNIECNTAKQDPRLFQIQRKNSTIIKSSYTSAQNKSLKTSLQLFRQNSTSRLTRDISHLQDIMRSSNSELDIFQGSIHILPKNIDQLRTYMNASQNVGGRIKSKRSQVCFKDRCLENLSEPSPSSAKWKILDDCNRISLELGSPTGNHDITNLKEWFKYMRENYLLKIIQEDKSAENKFKIHEPSQLENFELIIRAGLKEILRQITVQSYERGELLVDLVQNLGLFWSAKFEHFEQHHKDKYSELLIKISTLTKELNTTQNILKEKEKIFTHDIGVLRSDNLLKNVEIERLAENTKKLKAERVYRTKQELERYNQMIKEFKEFREYTLTVPEDPNHILIARALQKKKESLITLILSKLQLYHKNSSQYASRLTDEQLIEHEMLSTDSENIFVEVETQTEGNLGGKSVYINAVPETTEAGIETEELVNVIMEENSSSNRSSDYEDEEDKIFSKKSKEKGPFSIVVTTDNQENIIAFQSALKSFSELSENSKGDASEDSDAEKIENMPEVNNIDGKRRFSVMNFYKKREISSRETQTEDEVFLQLSKKDEEELLDWMLRDRKVYLKNIQREILSKKSELNKVSSIVKGQKNLLGQSFNLDDDKGGPSNLSESFEVSMDLEVDYLKRTGIVSKDTDISSWKNGYSFGYERARGELIGEGGSLTPRIASNKFDIDMNDDNSLIAESELNDSKNLENPARSKFKKSALGDDLKRNPRKGTRFQEFHFQRKEAKQFSLKLNSRPKFMDNLLEEDIKSIIKQTKMSRKMMLKTISSIYSAAITKTTVNDFETLANFVYDEFFAKYGQKNVAVKKIIDFMSALLKYPDSRRAINFLKLIGISSKIGLEDYSRPKQSFNFFINLNRMIEKSKLGIISIDEIADYQFIPAIRAIDCARELMSLYLDSNKVQYIITVIEKNSHSDPKKINKFGIIDLEFLQEYLLIEYDQYNVILLNLLKELILPFTQVHNQSKIHKMDFIMLLHYFCPEKVYALFNLKAPYDSFEKLSGHSKQKCLISVKRVFDLCFQYKLLHPNEIDLNFKEDLSNAKNIISEGLLSLNGNMIKVLQNQDKYGIDEYFSSNWMSKIKLLIDGKSFNNKSAMLVWKVLAFEIKRLTNEC